MAVKITYNVKLSNYFTNLGTSIGADFVDSWKWHPYYKVTLSYLYFLLNHIVGASKFHIS